MLRYQVVCVCDLMWWEPKKKQNNKKQQHVNSKQEQQVKKNRFELQCGNANIRQDKQSSEVQCVHTSNDFNTVLKERKKKRVEHFESYTHMHILTTHMHKTIVNFAVNARDSFQDALALRCTSTRWKTVSKSILGARAKNCSTLLSLLIA